MALSEIEVKRVEKAANKFMANRRPPEHIRSQLDIGWRLDSQSIYIFEIRPVWNNPSDVQKLDIAKATFVRTQGVWKVYWMRQDLKWHAYEPDSRVKSADQFFEVVDKDEFCCFFG
ncbi:DUF3024 domain-containing protein [Vibrio maritimus]|uniref:DUF3024 domain-containing protein n=1 Tax=Vibrio maritimus TaxID=990268 RepID=UPI0037357AE0